MKGLISFLALIWLAVGDPRRTPKDRYLDPGKIRWWKDTWAPNPIELSQANSGTSGVTVNINFRPQTSLPTTGNLGIVIVTVPSTFSSTTTYTSDSIAIKANTDTSYSFTLATPLPPAGVYGPFQIVTKTSTSGQIYNANYIFGCVTVSASISLSNSLTVSTVNLTSTTAVVGFLDGLYFTFAIPAGINLWKHDIFEIIPDSRWTIFSSPTCTSVDIWSFTNYIKGPKGENSLPCAIAASGGANGGYNTAKSTVNPATNSIYIYGLSQDVIINSSYQVKLQVSSFILPLATISASSFSWNLKIWRWGTTKLLAQYAGTGPLAPVPGSVTIISWVPYNIYLASTDIPDSSSNSFYLFTKLTFQAAHAITYGTIVITFDGNADISSGYWWQDHEDTLHNARGKCYLNNYIKGITCSVSGSKATITIAWDATLAAYTAISITLLTKLTTGAGIASIVTTDSATSANIDQTTSPYSWSFNSASTYVPMTSFQFFATATNEIPAGGTLTGGEQKGGYIGFQYLMWYMTPKNDWSTSTTLKISLPISNSGVQLLTSYISNDATYKEKILQSSDYASSAVALESAINTRVLSVGNPGSIIITFNAGAYPTTGGKNMFAFSYGDNSNYPAQVSLPFVASNVATFYECWAKATSTANGWLVTEFSSYVFSVITSLTDYYLNVASLCTDNYAGIPIAVVFHALNMKFNFGDSANLYYLDVEFSSLGSSNLGTGATDKVQIPVASAAIGARATLDPTSKKVTISGLGFVDVSNTVTVYLPYGGDITTSYTKLKLSIILWLELTQLIK
ncbi:unnamed protein product [Blepharisma stoltei]|uniref:Uncharacterized protein n=1 Tax=Blepharisma stoltei TaxID=1481888 RepID=A0AAU9IK57_9CILI|nr:unnamed protein product [Blepharisma stoltei]